MAPDAQIFVMKVFSSSGASDSDYFAALEDAIVLGADAANLSLGSASPGWTYVSTYQES
jgi:lactocepin